MKNLEKNLFLIFIISISIQLSAQERTIFGTVTAFKTIGVSNFKVSAKKAGTETMTDKNGRFTIKCTENDVLIFKSECFENLKKKIENEKDTIAINLFFLNSLKNKELAVFNNYIDEKTLEHALLNLPNTAKDYSKYTNIYELIKGECPTVQIVNNEIIVPPLTSVYESKGALIILDDIYVTDISYIIPSSVISVELLKGAEAGFYGLRGANGVIIIKTFAKK